MTPLRLMHKLGQWTISTMASAAEIAGMVSAALQLAFRPSSWKRTVRERFSLQLLFTGVDALPSCSVLAAMVGIAVVAQAQVWLVRFGQRDMLGPVLVALVLRGVAPLLAAFLVVGRSGTAMAAEMATMRHGGEVDLLEEQGIDPFLYLVMPRILGMACCLFAVTVYFSIFALGIGLLPPLLAGEIAAGHASRILTGLLEALTPGDAPLLIARTLIPGAVAAAICCREGLRIHGAATEIPQAASRAVVRAITAALGLSVLITLAGVTG